MILIKIAPLTAKNAAYKHYQEMEITINITYVITVVKISETTSFLLNKLWWLYIPALEYVYA